MHRKLLEDMLHPKRKLDQEKDTHGMQNNPNYDERPRWEPQGEGPLGTSRNKKII